MRILIVDDEPLARARIREMLKSETNIESIVEAANVGKRLRQDLRLDGGVDGIDRHDGSCGVRAEVGGLYPRPDAAVRVGVRTSER